MEWGDRRFSEQPSKEAACRWRLLRRLSRVTLLSVTALVSARCLILSRPLINICGMNL